METEVFASESREHTDNPVTSYYPPSRIAHSTKPMFDLTRLVRLAVTANECLHGPLKNRHENKEHQYAKLAGDTSPHGALHTAIKMFRFEIERQSDPSVSQKVLLDCI